MFTSDPHSTSASHHVLNAICICLSICSCLCVRVCVRWHWARGICVRVRVHSLWVSPCHHVQPCPCVSRVDVPKWGHFLSVWCLRNNPTAQKLLQPSASTYLSLYLYCSGYAFLFNYCPLHGVWLSACYDTITWGVWCLPCCSQYEVLMLSEHQLTSLTRHRRKTCLGSTRL